MNLKHFCHSLRILLQTIHKFQYTHLYEFEATYSVLYNRSNYRVLTFMIK